MKTILMISSSVLLILPGQVFAETGIETTPSVMEEEYTNMEVIEEEIPGREMYPYFSAGGRIWFSNMSKDGHRQGTLNMYGGEINIDITEKFGIGGTFMVGNDYLSQAERDVDRQDLDVALKYQFCRYLTGYLDFKRIDYDYKLAGQIPNTVVEYQETLNGIGFGLASAIPIAETGVFVYLGGGFIPFINFSNFDPLDTQVEKEVEYLYNGEGGVGYFLPTRYFDLMATVGYRLQVQRMKDHLGLPTQNAQSGAQNNPPQPEPGPQPGPVRITDRYNLVQQGIICGLRINW